MASTGPGERPAGRVRLVYLDGLRGLAVGFVVLHHLYLRLFDPAGTGRLAWGLPVLALPGRLAVAVFIVVSGYSLMIPVARSADGRLAGGVGRYARRRAWRILPPYYVALALSLAPMVPGIVGWPRLPWHPAGAARPDVTAPSVVAHLLLVHNLDPAWSRQINAPLWSLATEWQIYAAFPLVLLPVWRRAGGAVTVAVATAAGLALGRVGGLAQASPWYLGLFAAGMAAATINFGPGRRRAGPWWAAAMSAGAAAVVIGLWYPDALPAFDAACGAGVAAVLVDRTERARAGRATGLEAAGLVWLGAISYSLYLVHQPMIVIVDTVLTGVAHVTPAARWWAGPAAAVPLVGVAGWAFHRVVERPFMATASTPGPRVAVAVAAAA